MIELKTPAEASKPHNCVIIDRKHVGDITMIPGEPGDNSPKRYMAHITIANDIDALNCGCAYGFGATPIEAINDVVVRTRESIAQYKKALDLFEAKIDGNTYRSDLTAELSADHVNVLLAIDSQTPRTAGEIRQHVHNRGVSTFTLDINRVLDDLQHRKLIVISGTCDMYDASSEAEWLLDQDGINARVELELAAGDELIKRRGYAESGVTIVN